VDSSLNNQRQKIEHARNSSERSDGGFGHGDLPMVQEEGEREESSETPSEDADDEQELSKAATLIQEKYRQRMQRKSRGDVTLDTGILSGLYIFQY
jgi:hypothetical protein